jgi:hypothetical protein
MFRPLSAHLQGEHQTLLYQNCNNYQQLYNRPSKGKGKGVPLQAWTGRESSRRLRLPEFKSRHMQVVRFSAVRNTTGQILLRNCFMQ